MGPWTFRTSTLEQRQTKCSPQLTTQHQLHLNSLERQLKVKETELVQAQRSERQLRTECDALRQLCIKCKFVLARIVGKVDNTCPTSEPTPAELLKLLRQTLPTSADSSSESVWSGTRTDDTTSNISNPFHTDMSDDSNRQK